MLMEADIMLLDEPTNHLDVNNVAWLQNYLTSLTNVTSMVSPHAHSQAPAALHPHHQPILLSPHTERAAVT